MFNIISEIILLTVIPCSAIVYNTYQIGNVPYYFIILRTISYVPDNSNAFIFFQFGNLVFMMKQRYSHLKKRLTKWNNSAVSRQICLKNRTKGAANAIELLIKYI